MTPECRVPWRWLGAALLAQLLLSLVAVWRYGGYFYCIDEMLRLLYSMEFSRDAFFAKWDHEWLGGNFWLLGGMLEVIWRPVIIGQIHGVLTGLLATAAGWLWIWRISGRGSLAFAAALLFSSRPVMMGLSRSPMPDLFFFALLIGAILCGASHFARDSARFRASLPWLAGTLMVIAAQTLRYEAWFFSIPWGICALVFWGMSISHRQWLETAKWTGLGLALAIFPLLWMASSARVLGSPFAFLENLRELAQNNTPELDMSDPWQRAAFYPLYTFWQIPILGVLGLVGMAGSLWKKGREARFSIGMLAALWVLILTNTIVSGTGNAWPHRLALLFLGPLTLFAPLGFIAVLQPLSWPAGRAVILFLALGGSAAWNMTRTIRPFTNENIALHERFMEEHHMELRWMDAGAAIREALADYPDSRREMAFRIPPNFWGLEAWMLKLYSTETSLWEIRPDDWEKFLREPAESVAFVILQEERTAPERFPRLLGEFAGLTVYGANPGGNP